MHPVCCPSTDKSPWSVFRGRVEASLLFHSCNARFSGALVAVSLGRVLQSSQLMRCLCRQSAHLQSPGLRGWSSKHTLDCVASALLSPAMAPDGVTVGFGCWCCYCCLSRLSPNSWQHSLQKQLSTVACRLFNPSCLELGVQAVSVLRRRALVSRGNTKFFRLAAPRR